MSLMSSVTIEMVSGDCRAYDNVEKVSLGEKWVFLKFIDGGRMQIPSLSILAVREGADVYVKGSKNDVRSTDKPDIS